MPFKQVEEENLNIPKEEGKVVNNFTELEAEDINSFSQAGSHEIEKQIGSTLNVFRFISTIFDLYLTRVKDTLFEMGKEEDKNKEDRNKLP